jgi:hypothetical protein
MFLRLRSDRIGGDRLCVSAKPGVHRVYAGERVPVAGVAARVVSIIEA